MFTVRDSAVIRDEVAELLNTISKYPNVVLRNYHSELNKVGNELLDATKALVKELTSLGFTLEEAQLLKGGRAAEVYDELYANHVVAQRVYEMLAGEINPEQKPGH